MSGQKNVEVLCYNGNLFSASPPLLYLTILREEGEPVSMINWQEYSSFTPDTLSSYNYLLTAIIFSVDEQYYVSLIKPRDADGWYYYNGAVNSGLMSKLGVSLTVDDSQMLLSALCALVQTTIKTTSTCFVEGLIYVKK